MRFKLWEEKRLSAKHPPQLSKPRAPTAQANTQREKLWEALRDRRLAGLKFRRQHPYERFILDAYCAKYELEVEVDGEYHDDPKQAAYDLERTIFLQERGIRVLRFRNDEIENNFEDVLRRIIEATKKPSPPPPLPKSRTGFGRGGEKTKTDPFPPLLNDGFSFRRGEGWRQHTHVNDYPFFYRSLHHPPLHPPPPPLHLDPPRPLSFISPSSFSSRSPPHPRPQQNPQPSLIFSSRLTR